MHNDIALNTILYGPPGTGKTYNTVNYAVAICEGKSLKEVESENYSNVFEHFIELKNKGRIAFTTFHQSYGYEDFIEGIKPLTDDSGNIKYEVKNGIFKDFCKKVAGYNGTNDKSIFDKIWEKLVIAAKENGNQYTFTRRTGTSIAAKYIGTDRFRVEWNGKTNTHNDLTKAAIMNQWMNSEPNRDQLTGGTRWLYDAKQAVLDEMTKFGLPSFHADEGACVFIIDEINRGNISKVFGELITLIEPNKRDGAKEAVNVTLPFSGNPFSVPSNMYILGTMNTADRSIAIMDTALRRRFDFVEMQPNPSVLNGIKIVADGKELNVASMLQKINDRIEVLYDREHTIGHAFFMSLQEDNTIERLASIFQKNVIPLLQEYFYEDYQKIQMVLGDNGKERVYKFVADETVNNNLFRGLPEFDIPETTYRIQREAFYRIDSYIQI